MAVKKGYKQSAEHVSKRIRRGENHPNWVGESISLRGGRSRALRMYPAQPCRKCGEPKAERHHKDKNTSNNGIDNIEFLCRHCHLIEHDNASRIAGLAKLLNRKGSANSRAVLNEDQVLHIRTLIGCEPVRSIAVKFGVSTTHINRIAKRKAWGHL